MNFSTEGDPIVPGQEPELAPGVLGMAFDSPKGIYIPLIRAADPGSGAVSEFLDALPSDRRIVFPCVISSILEGMLIRRGFVLGIERDERWGGVVEVMQRCPEAALNVPFEKRCACGIVHDALAWAILPVIGYQVSEGEDERFPFPTELRNCQCGSTISVRIDASDLRNIVLHDSRHLTAMHASDAKRYGSAVRTLLHFYKSTEAS